MNTSELLQKKNEIEYRIQKALIDLENLCSENEIDSEVYIHSFEYTATVNRYLVEIILKNLTNGKFHKT